MLDSLICSGCTSLKNLPNGLTKLKYLTCSDCTSLVSMPKDLISLIYIYCNGCTSLTSILNRDLLGLKILYCNGCTSLTSLLNESKDEYKEETKWRSSLVEIECINCPSLTSIPECNFSTGTVNCTGCPWWPLVVHNPDYNSNISKLVYLQKFCKRNQKYFIFKRWIESREFAEWIYSPDQIGGKLSKKQISNSLSDSSLQTAV
jgi:hypothetical protein